MFGLFVENGPFSVTGSIMLTEHTFSGFFCDQFSFSFRAKENLELEERTTSWALTHNLIYIDNPVGM